MLNPFSLFSFLANALLYDAGSLIPGAVAGIFAGLLIGDKRIYTGLATAGILLIFALIIGVDTMLVKSIDIAIRLNVFLFGFALTMLITLFWRHCVLSEHPTDAGEKSVSHSSGDNG